MWIRWNDAGSKFQKSTDDGQSWVDIPLGLQVPITQHLTWSPDNTYDIGGTNAKPRSIYASTSINAPAVSGATLIASNYVSGSNYVFSGGYMIIQSGDPRLVQVDTGGTANKKRFDIVVGSSSFQFQARQDDATWVRNPLVLYHDGGAVIDGTKGNKTLILHATLTTADSNKYYQEFMFDGYNGDGVSGCRTSIRSWGNLYMDHKTMLTFHTSLTNATLNERMRIDEWGVVHVSAAPHVAYADSPGTGKYGLHINPESSTDGNMYGITFGAMAGGAVSAVAQAGIYIRSSASYGTRMFFATTDSYANGPKMRAYFDEYGRFNMVPGQYSAGGAGIVLGRDGWASGYSVLSLTGSVAVTDYTLAYNSSGTTDGLLINRKSGHPLSIRCNNSEHMSIDASGYVRHNNQPRCAYYCDQTIGNGAITQITFGADCPDVTRVGFAAPAIANIYPPCNGYYLIVVNINWNIGAGNGERIAWIYRDGTPYATDRKTHYNGTQVSYSNNLSLITYLSTSDYISVYVFQASGASLRVYSYDSYSSIRMFLLG